ANAGMSIEFFDPRLREGERKTEDDRLLSDRRGLLRDLSNIALFLLLLTVAFYSACKTPDSQRTYFIDVVAGDDRNIGTTPSAAWKTLDKVNQTVFHPGDNVLFKSGGRWIGQLWPKGSGTARHPILIDKYGGDARPII